MMGGHLKRRGLIKSQTPQMRVPETERRCFCIPGHQHATLHLESNPGQFSHESASPTEEKFTAHLRARPYRPHPTATAIGRHHQAAPPTALTPSPACTPSLPRPSLTLAPHIPPPPLHVQISQTAIAAEEGDEDPLRLSLCVLSSAPSLSLSLSLSLSSSGVVPQLQPQTLLTQHINYHQFQAFHPHNSATITPPLSSRNWCKNQKQQPPRNAKNRYQTCKPLEIVRSRPPASFLVHPHRFSSVLVCLCILEQRR
jgi:hypothetical protein